MKRSILATLILALAWAGAAPAADLSSADFAYLRAQFGVKQDSFLIEELRPEERTRLQALINEPMQYDYIAIRNANVADYLFAVRNRQCQAWSLVNPAQRCPPVTTPAAQPGQEIADRLCNACHLFGTSQARSFYRMATEGAWTEEPMAEALRAGHRMSPISLSPEQIRQLVAYIESFR